MVSIYLRQITRNHGGRLGCGKAHTRPRWVWQISDTIFPCGERRQDLYHMDNVRHGIQRTAAELLVSTGSESKSQLRKKRKWLRQPM